MLAGSGRPRGSSMMMWGRHRPWRRRPMEHSHVATEQQGRKCDQPKNVFHRKKGTSRCRGRQHAGIGGFVELIWCSRRCRRGGWCRRGDGRGCRRGNWHEKPSVDCQPPRGRQEHEERENERCELHDEPPWPVWPGALTPGSGRGS